MRTDASVGVIGVSLVAIVALASVAIRNSGVVIAVLSARVAIETPWMKLSQHVKTRAQQRRRNYQLERPWECGPRRSACARQQERRWEGGEERRREGGEERRKGRGEGVAAEKGGRQGKAKDKECPSGKRP